MTRTWLTAACAVMLLLWLPAAQPRMAPATCPQSWGGALGSWVPVTSDVPGAADSLVPGVPTAALICAYPGSNTDAPGWVLAGSRRLTGRVVTAMARDLDYLPTNAVGAEPICSLVGGLATNYLVRFAYPGGQTLWLGSATEVNSCVTTTNGSATSLSYIGPSIEGVYRHGSWSVAGPERPCLPTLGRRGQDFQVAPYAPIGVTVCRGDDLNGPFTTREYGAREAGALAVSLDALDARADEGGCHELSDDRTAITLVFHYADGPDAWVGITPGCEPAVSNHLLQADLDDATRELLTSL